MYLKFLIINLIFLSKIAAQTDTLNYFTGEFDGAIELAKKTKKPLFVEFGATWCAPCVKMEQETFTDSRIINTLNSKFIVVKIDVDLFSGMDIAEKYKVSEYPTYLFLDKTGKYYGASKGFFPANYFINEINKNNPDNATLAKTTKAKKKRKF